MLSFLIEAILSFPYIEFELIVLKKNQDFFKISNIIIKNSSNHEVIGQVLNVMSPVQGTLVDGLPSESSHARLISHLAARSCTAVTSCLAAGTDDPSPKCHVCLILLQRRAFLHDPLHCHCVSKRRSFVTADGSSFWLDRSFHEWCFMT